MGRGSSSLADQSPHLIVEWHPTKNGSLSPYTISYGVARKVWWICSKDPRHEWQASPNSRTRNLGTGCPYCRGSLVDASTCVATRFPELVAEWCVELNGRTTPDNTKYASKKKVWWVCCRDSSHIWEKSVQDRTVGGQGCPFCSGRRVHPGNCLAVRRPDISSEWHPTLNSDLTPKEIAFSSHKVVWWRCNLDVRHEWRASVNARTNTENGCPFCSGNRVHPTTCLAVTHSDVVSNWDFTKNSVTPEEVSKGSSIRVWWTCRKGHSWKARVADVVGHRSGCPKCRQSKGEELIADWLKSKGIPFERQKTFKGCEDKARLKFDFYLHSKRIAVEYDGKQHFQAIPWWGGDEGLRKSKRRDQIKERWCLVNGVRLIRIPYSESVSALLERELSQRTGQS